MNHVTPAIVAHDNAHPLAMLSPIMFAAGDEVEAKNPMTPFWMSITSVNHRTGFCRCKFGFSGRDAGNFHHTELKFYGGDQIDAALAS